MSKKKTSSELKAENRLLRQFNISSVVASVLNNLMKYGTVCFVFWMLYCCVDSLSGKITDANILVKFFGSLKANNGVAYIFGGCGLLYGMGERRLRKRTIGRLEGRIQKYEQQLDPNRSSSKLGADGDTNPKDRS
ncbi:MAG: hypothetical protein PHQ35_04415 [Phycisphaerae bacterium]|nr:hypothetical protein [Phycisphaerae bacterium]MDD5380237.1 hypothetical protein [Phycisphaerae bacterium]